MESTDCELIQLSKEFYSVLVCICVAQSKNENRDI